MRKLRIGSDEHKELFCRWFIDTHRAYDAGDLSWPELDEPTLARLRAVPIWGSALQAETRAGVLVTRFAQTLSDPLIREATALQGLEEQRHARVFAAMAERYGLNTEAEPLYVKVTERAFLDFAYKECLDEFLGVGAFRLAREMQFFPDEFLSMFSWFMTEEARHVVFFTNWIAYERVRRNRGAAALQAGATAVGYVRALRMLPTAVNSANNGSGFLGDGNAFKGITLKRYLETCVRENALQMSAFDPRLLRPRVLPGIAQFVLSVMYAIDACRNERWSRPHAR